MTVTVATVRAQREIRPDNADPETLVFGLTGETLAYRVRAAAEAADLGDGFSDRIGMAKRMVAAGAPNSTALPARARNVQCSWPSGEECRPRPSGASRPGRPACGTGWLGPVLQHAFQPVFGETPLDAVCAGLGQIQGLGYLGSRPALGGLEQDVDRVATRAGLLPVQTRCSNCSRSSRVSRTGNFSRIISPPHNDTIQRQHRIPAENSEPPSKSTLTG